jgi:hypothetical protein
LVEKESMEEKDCRIGTRVIIPELNMGGTIYESGIPDYGLDRVYGIQLDKTAFPRNFVATTVWHCKAGELILKKEVAHSSPT